MKILFSSRTFLSTSGPPTSRIRPSPGAAESPSRMPFVILKSSSFNRLWGTTRSTRKRRQKPLASASPPCTGSSRNSASRSARTDCCNFERSVIFHFLEMPPPLFAFLKFRRHSRDKHAPFHRFLTLTLPAHRDLHWHGN